MVCQWQFIDDGLTYERLKDPEAVTGDKKFDKARLAFGENYGRLQQLKRKYDPENIFNKWFPIVPAASDST